MNTFIGSGVMAAVAAGSLLVAGTPPSASATTPTTEATTERGSAEVKPPKIKQVRYTCHPENASVSLKIRNPNRMELSWQVRLFSDDVQEAQAVTLAGKTAERVEFDGLPDGEFTIHILDAAGDTVATHDGVVVDCPPLGG